MSVSAPSPTVSQQRIDLLVSFFKSSMIPYAQRSLLSTHVVHCSSCLRAISPSRLSLFFPAASQLPQTPITRRLLLIFLLVVVVAVSYIHRYIYIYIYIDFITRATDRLTDVFFTVSLVVRRENIYREIEKKKKTSGNYPI